MKQSYIYTDRQSIIDMLLELEEQKITYTLIVSYDASLNDVPIAKAWRIEYCK